MKCANPDCGRTIPYEQGAWLQYVGYARPKNLRQGISGSSLIGRKPTGKALCGLCATKLEHGLASGQESML